MAYGSPSSRSLRNILYRVAAEFNGDHNTTLLAAVGGDPSATVHTDKMSILTVLRIVEEAVLGVTATVESTPVLARVRNLAELFDIDLLHYPRPPPDIFDQLVAEAEATGCQCDRLGTQCPFCKEKQHKRRLLSKLEAKAKAAVAEDEDEDEDEEAGRLVIEKFPPVAVDSRPYRHPKAEPDEFMSDGTFDG